MVKVGFVVEGPSEKRLVDSAHFQALCVRYGVEICKPIIVVKGVGNGGRDLTGFIRDCHNQAKPEKVLVLVDADDAPCFQSRKATLGGIETADAVVLAKRTLEAWFMADMEAFSRWAQRQICIPFPEQEAKNIDFLKKLAKELGIRGADNHQLFARTMISPKIDFSIERAAQHPHCPSAAYFLRALARLAS